MTSRAGNIFAIVVAVLVVTVLGKSSPSAQDQGVQVRAAGYAPYGSTNYQPSADGLPDKTQEGQSGTNKCGTKSSDGSLCQNLVSGLASVTRTCTLTLSRSRQQFIAGPTDWCLYAPPTRGNVSDVSVYRRVTSSTCHRH